MPEFRAVPASNFGRYQDEAIKPGLINVTSHGRVVGTYLSVTEFKHFERLKLRERQVLKTGELDEETLVAIEAAEYGVTP